MNIHRSDVLTALAWLVPHETAAISAQVLCTPYNHAPCHFMQNHMMMVMVMVTMVLLIRTAVAAADDDYVGDDDDDSCC